MSELGQNAKYSERADNFRFAPINGHHQARTPCRKSARSGLLHATTRARVVVPVNGASARASAAVAPMTTTVVLAARGLGPAAALWLAATKASASAYASGWQSAVVEALMSWAAGSGRKPWPQKSWRQGGPFVPGLPEADRRSHCREPFVPA